MEWAKTKKAARFNLSRSGVPDQPLAVLDATLADVEIDGGGGYGWPPLLRALGAHLGVPPDEIVHLPGTSMANFVALAGLLGPGDDVLIERPTLRAPRLGGALPGRERRPVRPPTSRTASPSIPGLSPAR